MNTIYSERPISRTIVLTLFVLPIVCGAGILGVVVHEFIGHRLAAILLGGKFSDFILKWYAINWVFSPMIPTAPQQHQIFGVIATTLFGGILLGLVFLFRKRTDIQLALLVVSFICLMNGIPYVLWNPYFPGRRGRIMLSSISQHNPHISTTRWDLFALGVLLFAAMTLYFCTSVFLKIEELIFNGKQSTGRTRILALFFFLVLPGSVSWFKFDWAHLIPGIGLLPCVVGSLSILAMAVLLFWYKPKSKHEGSVHPITWRHIIVSWTCLTSLVITLLLWFKYGVRWI